MVWEGSYALPLLLERFEGRCIRVERAFNRGPQFAPLLRELGWSGPRPGCASETLRLIKKSHVDAALKRRSTRTGRRQR
jgi:hypothetical protein